MARTKRPATKLKVITVVHTDVTTILSTGERISRRVKPAGQRQGGQRKCSVGKSAQWAARFEEAKRWVSLHGGYPRYRKSSSQVELSLYKWLHYNLPWRDCFLPERWTKLNEAFGVGWEHDFSPGRASWAARLEEAKRWVSLHGGYPRRRKSSSQVEKSLYNWLQRNLPGRDCFLPERWTKLNEAFGVGWEHDFSPRLISHHEDSS